MIRFECQCGKIYQVSDQYAGKKTKCPKCGNVCLVPSAEVQGSESIIKFFCSQCGQKIKVPKEYSGKKCKCPKCQFLCIIPCLSNNGLEMPDSHDIEKETNTNRLIDLETSNIKGNNKNTETPSPEDASSKNTLVNFKCLMCNEDMKAPANLWGQMVLCPNCGCDVEVPEKEPLSSFRNESEIYNLKEPTKRCPYCGEEILERAIKCKHCGGSLENNGSQDSKISENFSTASPSESLNDSETSALISSVIGFVIGVIIVNFLWPFAFLYFLGSEDEIYGLDNCIEWSLCGQITDSLDVIDSAKSAKGSEDNPCFSCCIGFERIGVWGNIGILLVGGFIGAGLGYNLFANEE